MPLQATSGAASYDAFGGGVPVEPNYIESVFSCFLYTGNGSTQTITNGIDLAGKGGLVWAKSRSSAFGHTWFDTVRGSSSGNARRLASNSTAAATTTNEDWLTFNANGFTANNDPGGGLITSNGATYASWTFREQPKFVAVVTYTGNGTTQNIAHSLGSVPGCIIVKRTDAVQTWPVYHRSLATNERLILETTAATDTSSTTWNNTAPTSTVFTVGGNAASNASGGTYVAYLFAHNAGGFGLTGTDNVISCGSFTTDGSKNATVNLGYEPQFVLIKTTGVSGSWLMTDTMRGMPDTSGVYAATLSPNSPSAENTAGQDSVVPIATGFKTNAPTMQASQTYIYIAIRRGPMKTPTSGTSVFSAQTYSGSGSTRTLDASIVPDLYIGNTRDPAGGPVGVFVDRLRGNSKYVRSYDTSAETGTPPARDFSNQTGFTLDGNADNVSGRTYVSWFMRRAPGFFDEVCFTATGTSQSVNHNLQAVPELMICKRRNSATAGNWTVYSAALGNTKILYLNDTAAQDTNNNWDNTTPTSTTFNVNNNISGGTYVNYLFASCPGVSKVGSYTGNGTTLQVNCGFTAGARFVLIKRTDSTGDWYVWDSARGIVAGNDPYLLLNSTAAEVTSTDYVDTYAAGFELTSTAPAAINASGGSFIYLAIA